MLKVASPLVFMPLDEAVLKVASPLVFMPLDQAGFYSKRSVRLEPRVLHGIAVDGAGALSPASPEIVSKGRP